jgi:hypothetical protein
MILGRTARFLAIALLAASSLAGSSRAGQPLHRRPAQPSSAKTLEVLRRIDVNNINMIISNQGSFANDLGNVMNLGSEGLVYPKGTTKTAVYAAGPWIGAMINGGLHVTVAEYSYEYGPGNILAGSATVGNPAGTSAAHSNPDFVVYKVVRWTGDPADSAHIDRSAEALAADNTLDPLVHHSWSEYMHGAAPYGAPWKYYRLPTSVAGDSVDVPGPDVLGDMMCWSVCNDADPALHTNEAGSTAPMGLELQQTTFAFNRQGPLGNTIFVKYKLINKGLNTLDQTYISQWSDPDLGGFTDDLVGCDTLPDRSGKPRSLGYCYNATNNDQLYGSAPPAVGYDFFQGPKGSGGTPLPMSSFNKYINGTDPASADATYNYMLGLNSDGSDVVDPFGQVTRFNVAGDPVSPGPFDWLDSNPADRRLMLSSGPFTMAPGDTQDVVVGLVIGQGNSRLSSISGLRFYDDFAQAAFDSSFNLPSPPPQPKVTVSQDHGDVTLSWDTASRFNYHQPGYAFEGYNVYQGETVAGPWHLLATYDEIDNIRVIFDQVFDVTTGQVIPNFPVAFGSDDGVQYSFTTSQDAVRGGPLHDATQYYFAVTAYSYNPSGLPKVLENAQSVVRVMPQRPAAGTALNTAGVGAVAYLQKDTSRPPSTDQVTVNVVNPEKLTGDTYKVTFQHLASPETLTVSGQTEVVSDTWSLTDSTTNTVLYTGQVNRLGDADYRVVDGIQVIVKGNYVPDIADASYQNNNTAHRRALTGVNWGLRFFNGGADYEDSFGALHTTLNSSMPDSFETTELRFGTPQKCYRFFRLEKASDGSPPPQGRAYPYGGFFDCPFQVWDTLHNRQLDAVFVERMLTADDGTYLPLAQQPATQDSTWDPGSDPNSTELGSGDREYLAVLNTPYSDTAKPQWTVNGAPVASPAVMPLTYFLGAELRTPTDVLDPGDKFVWTWAVPANGNDVYAFQTTKLAQNNAALARQRLAAIRVVPNPYYSHSAYELNQFNRVVRFINLPEQCTIRIFNLAGQIVRTLNKTNASSSVLDWDLLTNNQLPVGSGVYIYYVDAKGVGTQVGRCAVFMEKERLNNF